MTLGAGLAAIAVQVGLAALLMVLAPSPEWLMAGIAASFLFGVPLGIAITRTVPALAFPAMGLFALSGLTAVFAVDLPLWGSVIDLEGARSIPAGAGVAGYSAYRWRIDADRSLEERISAGRGNKSYGSRRVAPLVEDGWTPDRAVEIWVSGETRDSGRVPPGHPKFWAEPGGEFARLVGNDVSGAQLAAKRAAQRFGLRTTEEPLIVMRVPSVAAAVADQRWAVVAAARYPVAAWVVLIGIAAMVVRWKERR